MGSVGQLAQVYVRLPAVVAGKIHGLMSMFQAIFEADQRLPQNSYRQPLPLPPHVHPSRDCCLRSAVCHTQAAKVTSRTTIAHRASLWNWR